MSPGNDELMIRTVDLRVDYGDFTAVRDVSLEIAAGQVYGLIGPNGAGKTSTMNVLATLLEPTYGEVHIAGIDAAEEPRAVHRILGYMPDWAPVYANLRAWEFLDLFAAAHAIPPDRRRAVVDDALQAARLTAERNRLAGALSRGMKQRLVLAKCLLHDPEVLILDEPASGLDPAARVELRDLLRELAGRGKTVMISSHILTELQSFCTAIGIMDQGRLVVSGAIEEVIANMTPVRTVAVELLGQRDHARSVLEGLDAVRRVEPRGERGLAVIFEGEDEDLAQMLTALVRAELPVKSFHELERNVEDVFMQLDAASSGHGEGRP
jgi:ABC-2 type transport system ATP-binding protein